MDWDGESAFPFPYENDSYGVMSVRVKSRVQASYEGEAKVRVPHPDAKLLQGPASGRWPQTLSFD